MDLVDVRALNVTTSPLCKEDLEMCKDDGSSKQWARTPFPIEVDINERIVLHDGDLSLLKADAIVNPTNENLTQLGFVSKLAGPELEGYLKKKIKVCPTGDVRLTPGFRSNFRYIIHAVPPKYQPKYKTAAETALFHTYFRILETMIERKIRTVVMPILATPKSNLPLEENCHMQLRTIRRILEKKRHEFDKIVVYVAQNKGQYVLPFYCYFPQASIDEEIACYYFKNSIGGPNGEPVIPEREIRIKSKPGILDQNDRSVDLTSGLDLSTVVGKTPFSLMRDDLDAHRLTLKSQGFKKVSRQASNQVAIRKTAIFRGCTLL